MAYEVITYRREELYEQVWAEPTKAVAKRYGVSDVWLAKICKKLRVPLPGRGYWARKVAGQNPRRTPLRPVPAGSATELRVERRKKEHESPLPHVEAALELEKQRPEIKLVENMDAPHKLVAIAEKRIRRKKPSENGLVDSWDLQCLDIRVSPAQLDRALKLVDTLVRACDERGVKFEVTPVKAAPDAPNGVALRSTTRLLVGEDWIEIRLVEKVDVEVIPAPKPPKGLTGHRFSSWEWQNQPAKKYTPNGRLELSLTCGFHRASWTDAKRRRVEDCLGDFFVRLHLLAGKEQAERAAREEMHRRWEEEARLRREAAQRALEEKERVERLEVKIGAWRMARDIREYVAEMRAACSLEQSPRNGGRESELIWALAYAEQIDPVSRAKARHNRCTQQTDESME